MLVWLPKAENAIANPYKLDKAGLNTHMLSLSRPFCEIYWGAYPTTKQMTKTTANTPMKLR